LRVHAVVARVSTTAREQTAAASRDGRRYDIRVRRRREGNLGTLADQGEIYHCKALTFSSEEVG